MPRKIFPLKFFRYGATYKKVPFFTDFCVLKQKKSIGLVYPQTLSSREFLPSVESALLHPPLRLDIFSHSPPQLRAGLFFNFFSFKVSFEKHSNVYPCFAGREFVHVLLSLIGPYVSLSFIGQKEIN